MALICDNRNCSNIGRRLDGRFHILQKWNPRYSQVLVNQDQGLPCVGGYKWLMRMKTQGKYSYGNATDSNRNWTTPYQDIVVFFNTKCQDAVLSPGGTATGHTIKINTVVQTTTYQSGSGGAKWILRIPVLVDANDAITYSYDATAGNTTAVDNSQEIATVTNLQVNNLLTRRIRFILKKADNTPVASATVKICILKYNAGAATEVPGDNVTAANPQGGIWMRKEMWQTATTGADGLLDIKYTHISSVGTTVYIVVYHPNATPTESFAWVDTIK